MLLQSCCGLPGWCSSSWAGFRSWCSGPRTDCLGRKFQLHARSLAGPPLCLLNSREGYASRALQISDPSPEGSRAIYWAVHFFIWPSSLIGPGISFLMLFLFGTRASTRLVACTCMLHARMFISFFLFFLLHAQIYIISFCLVLLLIFFCLFSLFICNAPVDISFLFIFYVVYFLFLLIFSSTILYFSID